jgi:DNA-directed RNA polymerase subunit RPC12/RpoP
MAKRQMTQRGKNLLVLLILWVLLVLFLFTHHHGGWAVVTIFLPIGLLIGIGRQMSLNANKISKVGIKGGTGVQCPKCGGTQFKAKRSAGGKVGLGVLAPKTRVRCVTCGTQYTRG